MKESYLTKACRKTVRERFPEREAVLNFAFEKRRELRSGTCRSEQGKAATPRKSDHAGHRNL